MKILVFAGTTEGRVLIEKLLAIDDVLVCACVATEYGKEILEHESANKLEIKAGRLEPDEMQKLMLNGFDFVIDATHPYATVVTDNIKESCKKTKNKYIRLLRDKTDFGPDCIFVENTDEAVKFLNTTRGNVLLTTGSKELVKYTKVENFEERLFARVLPMEQVLKSCNELGFSGKHLICMQGPFSYELNKAMLKQLNCAYMVTKDTGKEGGAYEKYQAAKQAKATLVVVGRKENETGLSLEQILQEIGTKKEVSQFCDWFPMFVNINNRNIAVIGAGKIASRRIKSLLQFSCNLRIIAKDISEEVNNLINEYRYINEEKGSNRSIEFFKKDFHIDDISGADIVITATNSRELNKSIGNQCREKGILVNVADAKDECDFYFPGVVINGDLVVGITAGGKSHSLAKKGSELIRDAVRNI